MKNLFFALKDIPQSFYLLGGRILLGFGQLVMIRILTTFLEPAEIGKYYLLMSAISWISLFLIAPVNVYISRHIHGWNNAGIAPVAVRNFIGFLSIISVLSALFFFFIRRFSLLNLDISFSMAVLIVPLLIPAMTLSRLFPSLCNLLGKYRSFIVLSNMEVWGKLAAIFLFCSALSPSMETVLVAIVLWGIVVSVTAGFSLYRIMRKGSVARHPFNSDFYKDVFRFSWPLALGSALFWGQSEGYRFVLERTSGADFLGKFVVAYSLGAALMIAMDTLFHQLYMPVFYKEISAETDASHIKAWNKYSKHLVGVCIPVGIYIACAGPFLSYWLVAERYRSIGIYAAIGAFSQLFRILSAASYFGIVAQKNTTSLILPNALGAVMALAGTWYLSETFPMLGTGVSLIASHILVCILTYACLRARLAVRIPWLRMVQATIWTLPIGLTLLMAYRLGWEARPATNAIVLLLTGGAMAYLQWKLSKNVWFQRELTQEGGPQRDASP